MKQVVFISGGEVFDRREEFKEWLASPESDFMLPQPGAEPVAFWSRNLQEDLGEEYEVLYISMPLKQHARYDEWKIWFEKHIQFVEDQLVLVGWSLGANFLYKYLSENTFSKEIEQLHLVAGCFGCKGGFEIETEKGLEADVYVYHSVDDTIVPFEDAQEYIRVMPQASLIEYQDKGHFLVTQIPELIDNIKNN